MQEKLILLVLGAVFILSGIFKWWVILAIFAWRDPPKTKTGTWEVRIVSIIVGVLSIAVALNV